MRNAQGLGDNKDAAVIVGSAMIGTAASSFLIDYRTGAMYEHGPNEISIQLTPVALTKPARKGERQ